MPVAAVTGHQRRVERGDVRHQARVGDNALAPGLRIGDDGRHRHLAAGARGGGHGIDRRRPVQAAEVAREVARGAAVGRRQPDHLGRVDDAAAAERDDRVAPLGQHQRHAALDHRDRRVGRHGVEQHVRRTRGIQCGQKGRDQLQAHDVGVGDDEQPPVPEAGQVTHMSPAAKGTRRRATIKVIEARRPG
jgi:hypothetical protein